MAQLAEQSLPTSEVRGSNKDIGEFYIEYLHLLLTVLY